jgi:putative DNA primase/helicase
MKVYSDPQAITTDAAEQLAAFVDAIYEPDDIVETRPLRGEDAHPTWHAAADLPALADLLASHNADGWNIYAGANPRSAKGAKGDAAIKLARVVYADFDGVQLDAIAASLADARLPQPTLVVASGHGFHVYWRLSEPCTDLSAWRELMWDLAIALGGDVKVRNPERIMRIPGFLNVKREPFVRCRIIECEPGRRVSLADLRSIIPARPLEKKAERKSTPANNGNSPDGVKRCMAYLAKLPSAVSGSGGHDATFQAACECVRFGLSESEQWDAMQWFNANKCDPPWSEKELTHKIKSAQEKAAGEAGSRLREDRPGYRAGTNGNGRHTAAPSSVDEPDEFSPSDPLPIARAYRRRFHTHPDGPTLYSDVANTFYAWPGSHFDECKEPAIRAEIYPWLEKAKKLVKRGDGMELVPFAPTAANVNNVLDALRAECFTAHIAPCWLSADEGLPDPKEIIPAQNGLIWLRANAEPWLYSPPTPRFFSMNALDFPFSAKAPTPVEWLRFLSELWEEDEESIQLLQEWFGYCLTADTRQQKALLLVGPKRAGKGTIARVLTRLIGAANVCGPTLSGLSTNFGLWALIGKLVAIISDARLSGRTDQAVITERILAIVGEDSITIDRKNQEPVTTRLLTRLMILTNELPKLADASGALASRFLVLTLSESFYGREDTGLEDRICAELPGILLWAIQGWQRLNRRGHFIQPASSQAAIEELNDLASPIGVFLREWCVIQPGASIPVADLFEGWQFWCAEQGATHAGTKQTFGRDLRAAVPRITTSQRSEDIDRVRIYEGIKLTISAVQTVSIERGKREGKP